MYAPILHINGAGSGPHRDAAGRRIYAAPQRLSMWMISGSVMLSSPLRAGDCRPRCRGARRHPSTCRADHQCTQGAPQGRSGRLRAKAFILVPRTNNPDHDAASGEQPRKKSMEPRHPPGAPRRSASTTAIFSIRARLLGLAMHAVHGQQWASPGAYVIVRDATVTEWQLMVSR